ncbi:MAG: hypothetical protein WC024_05290 [Shewanella sp.]|jgi:hypothetical protein|uniref:hypothetical protein n=1 Tax=unclassified Shewanella TaxID=196818 RepID=UPI0021D81F5D|nr:MULTISPECIES: hypothetical protein [unclassified Shewanella]MCU8034508.1 hypothetical protein [Shewanella sp. SM71]MCU8096215.1 hypothetical protein [Shewanella sp. SM102]
MLELLIPLKKTVNQSAKDDLEHWLSSMPDGAAWYVISDYCFGDKTKQNDTVSFTVLLHHDKLNNIKEYINHFAPKDIKSTRTVSVEFLQYINSPVTFSFTFVIDRKANLLRDYATDENMLSFLPAFRNVVSDIASNSTFQNGYVDGVMKRVRAFEADFSKKNFNSKLARQIYIVSAFASVVFEVLAIAKKPKYIQWISDRDALLERYDSFAFDLSYFLFLQSYSVHFERKENSVLMLDTPQFLFPEPEKSGKNHYDELIRIPDYLAGTLADLDVSSNKFTKDKYNTILLNSLVNSRNQAVIYVTGKGNDLCCKRLVHKA